jgi:hypothetical protein
VRKTQDIIYDILGDHRRFVDRLPSLVRVTGGATEDRPRRLSQPQLKLRGHVRAPFRSHKLLKALGTYFGATIRPDSCEANRVVMVPKNYKTHRTIACEPTGSLPIQLAFDSYVKGRLKRNAGIDLSSQMRNQELAREGSISGDLATIDLSMASDTLSYNTVCLLLPHPWFKFLASLRASNFTSKFGDGRYAKFSSMGNGATFPLETLIFYAACRAIVGPKSVLSVYGDDIIVPSKHFKAVLKYLKFLGFIPNEEKSFVDGPFRESCGTDWLDGKLVTPFYVRKLPKSDRDFHHFINGMFSCSVPEGHVWQLLRELIAQRERPPLYVPYNEDSCSGIFIDTRSAYELGILHMRSRKSRQYHVLCFKAQVNTAVTRRLHGWRSRLLWFLIKNHESAPKDVMTSSCDTGQTRTARKYRPFQPVGLYPSYTFLIREWLSLEKRMSHVAKGNSPKRCRRSRYKG